MSGARIRLTRHLPLRCKIAPLEINFADIWHWVERKRTYRNMLETTRTEPEEPVKIFMMAKVLYRCDILGLWTVQNYRVTVYGNGWVY